MIKNPYPGKFIAFEGMDGCGKTTQCDKAVRYMLAGGERVLKVKEPNKEVLGGKLIYGLLFGRGAVAFSSMSPLQRQSHYFFNRMQHYVQVVIPALKAGINVLSDRSFASISLEGLLNDNLWELLLAENYYFEMEEIPFIRPDLIMIYDVDPAIALQRLSEKDERRRDFFEQPDKLPRSRQSYLDFAQKFGDFCQVVDAFESADLVFSRYTRELLQANFQLREWKQTPEKEEAR